MLHAAQFLATYCTALFAGAALYVNLVEHPARLAPGTRAALAQWAPSYKRATWLQAPLAIAACLAALVAWLLGADTAWLIASLVIGGVVPFTLLGVMPTNRRLLDPGRDPEAVETRTLLERWAALHAVRTIAGAFALALMLWLLSRP